MHRVRWSARFLIAALMVAACTNSPAAPSGSSVTVTAVNVTGSNALPVGATVTMTAIATESDGSTKNVTTSASWLSSNPPVAMVSSAGEVTGVAAGTSTISASYQGATGQLAVQVNPSTPGAPISTSAPTITGTAAHGQPLAATAGTWSGSTPMVFAYQWDRCSASGSNCSSVTGANTSTFVLGTADVGQTIRVSVTATNRLGSSTATSAPTSVVQ
jgi:Bacterial Ig-like domain (group 2)